MQAELSHTCFTTVPPLPMMEPTRLVDTSSRRTVSGPPVGGGPYGSAPPYGRLTSCPPYGSESSSSYRRLTPPPPPAPGGGGPCAVGQAVAAAWQPLRNRRHRLQLRGLQHDNSPNVPHIAAKRAVGLLNCQMRCWHYCSLLPHGLPGAGGLATGSKTATPHVMRTQRHAIAGPAFTGSRRGIACAGATPDRPAERLQGSSNSAHPVASAKRWGVNAARRGTATKRPWTAGILCLLRVRRSGRILTATTESSWRRSGHYLDERCALEPCRDLLSVLCCRVYFVCMSEQSRARVAATASATSES